MAVGSVTEYGPARQDKDNKEMLSQEGGLAGARG